MENVYSDKGGWNRPFRYAYVFIFVLLLYAGTAQAYIYGDTQACPGSTKMYSTYVYADRYDWYVSGGTVVANYGHSIEVYWNGSGTGHISLYTTSYGGCDYCYPQDPGGGGVFIPDPGMGTGENGYYTYTVNITSASAGTVTATSPTVCAGGGTELRLSNSSGEILGWERYENGYWQSIGEAGANSILASNINQNTSFRARVRTTCGVQYSSAATVTVHWASVGGYVFGPGIVLEGPNQGELVLSGHTGQILRWETSVGGVNWQHAGTAGSSRYYFYNLTATTHFRVLVQNGVCPPAYSYQETVQVRPLIRGDEVACPGVPYVYSSNGFFDNYSWTVSSGGTIVSNWQHSIEVVWDNSAGLKQVNLQAWNGSPYEIPVDGMMYRSHYVTVKSAGSIRTDNPIVCQGAYFHLDLINQEGDVVRWEKFQNGSWQHIDFTGTRYFTSLQSAATFRALVRLSCGEEYSRTITVNVTPGTNGGYASGPGYVIRYVNQGTVQLHGQVGQVLNWEASTDGGQTWYNLGVGGTSYSFQDLEQTTKFRAWVQNGNCLMVPSAETTVEVMPVIYSTAEACINQQQFYGSNMALQYYSWEVSGGYIASGAGTSRIEVVWNNDDSPKTISLTGITAEGDPTGDFPAMPGQTIVAGRYIHEIISVTVNRTGGGSLTATHSNVCAGGSTTLNFTNYAGEIKRWEQSPDGQGWTAVTGHTAASLSLANVQATTSYRVVLDGGSCGEIYSNTVRIRKWDPVVDGTITGSKTVEAGNNSGAVSLTDYQGVIQAWYKSDDGGETWESIGYGSSASVPYNDLTATTLYRAYLTGGPCGGDKFTATATIWVERRLNWVHSTGYDDNGVVAAEARTYTDALGREAQSLVKSLSRSNVLASQPLYDRNGQAVGQTLPAPIGNTFDYRKDFITYGGAPYNHTHFDGDQTNAPLAPAGAVASYYSTSNTNEPLVAATSFPYSMTHTDPVGGSQRSSLPGDDLVMGSGKEVKQKSMPVLNELDHYLSLRDRFVPGSSTPKELRMKAVKQVIVDQNGTESVTFTDLEGRVLASCLTNGTYDGLSLNASLTAGPAGVDYVDAHIPVEGATISIEGNGRVNIYNLTTGDIIPTDNAPIRKSLEQGFYRIQSLSGAQELSYDARYGDFTYNYYNDAGQLVATVAPEGVKSATAESVSFVTTFQYNSIGQLLSTTSPDEGTTRYVYRKDGQIRFSQNARQSMEGKFSYTNYDRAGRLIEAGEYTMSPNPSEGIVFEDHLTATPKANSVLSEAVLESTAPGGGLDAARCGQQVFNFYDEPVDDEAIRGRKQRFTVGALVKSRNENSATWYSYDADGRTEWTVQEIEGFGVVTLDYTYGPNGSVSKAVYQDGKPDMFVHEYSYDADGRLLDVHTARQDVKTLHARYSYYLHGPLKRTELGGNLQGVDYTYTVQGWLKGINHYDRDMDPGKDGISNAFSRDLFGMTLQYYPSDYASKALGSWNVENTGRPALHNGMIAAQAWHSEGQPAPQAYAYEYDSKYQLKDARFGTLTKGTGSYTYTGTENNREQVPGYDTHGNIKELKRTNGTGGSIADYKYDYMIGTNKLQSVANNGNVFLRYEYDQLGQMTYQSEVVEKKVEGVLVAEEVKRYLAYDVSGKVTGVYKDQAMMEPIVQYFYDERGQRVRKIAYDPNTANPSQPITSWYITDAAGNLQSLYKTVGTGAAALEETPVYGAGRIGMLAKRPDGSGREYLYELSDHLGNVRAVFRNPDQLMMMATMEPMMALEEEENFDHLAETRMLSETYARTGRGSARLHAGSGRRYGPTRLMQVQPGDSVGIRAWFSYRPQRDKSGGVMVVPYATPGKETTPAGERQSGLSRALERLQLGFALIPKAKPAENREGRPMAFVQYAFYDKDSVYISGGRRPMTRSAENNWEEVMLGAVAPEDAAFAMLAVEQDGGEPVYVDDVMVTQSGGMLVQEKHLYPFGMELEGMGYRDGSHNSYRYGYQGQFAEHDSLTGWDSFELRQYDSRIGRWTAPDPYGQYFSTYVGMGNDPVNQVDPDGGFSGPGGTGTILGVTGPQVVITSSTAMALAGKAPAIGINIVMNFAMSRPTFDLPKYPTNIPAGGFGNGISSANVGSVYSGENIFVEAYSHYQTGGRNTLHVLSAALDLSGISMRTPEIQSIVRRGPGRAGYIDLFSHMKNQTGLAIGSVLFIYHGKNVFSLSPDRYDFDIRRKDGFTSRNLATFAAGLLHGPVIDDKPVPLPNSLGGMPLFGPSAYYGGAYKIQFHGTVTLNP